MGRSRNGERRKAADRERAQSRTLAAAGLRRSHRVTAVRAIRAVDDLHTPETGGLMAAYRRMNGTYRQPRWSR